MNHSMNTIGITPWNYVGVVCFPNLENRRALQDAEAVNNVDELKVLIKTIHSIISYSLLFLDGSDKRRVRRPGLVESKCCLY